MAGERRLRFSGKTIKHDSNPDSNARRNISGLVFGMRLEAPGVPSAPPAWPRGRTQPARTPRVSPGAALGPADGSGARRDPGGQATPGSPSHGPLRGNPFSTERLGRTQWNSLGPNPDLRSHRDCHSKSPGGSRGRRRLRSQPDSRPGAVPSCFASSWRVGRVLGRHEVEEAAPQGRRICEPLTHRVVSILS